MFAGAIPRWIPKQRLSNSRDSVQRLLPARPQPCGLRLRHGAPLLVTTTDVITCHHHRYYRYIFSFFRYVLTTLDQLVAEDYNLIYFHGATPKHCIPRFSWVKNCYQMINRRLRKNLKRLYLVHPTLWLKAAVLMCRPFIRYHQQLSFVSVVGTMGQGRCSALGKKIKCGSEGVSEEPETPKD